MRSREPARSEPPGAPRPLDSATDSRSNGAAELGHRPAARDRGIPQPGAVQIAGDVALTRGGADLLRPMRPGRRRRLPRLCVFSMQTTVVGGYVMCPRGLTASTNSSAVKTPRDPTSVNCTPALAAAPPVSYHTTWLSRLTMTSSPGRVSRRRAIWLAIVPLGTHSAAVLPDERRDTGLQRR